MAGITTELIHVRLYRFFWRCLSIFVSFENLLSSFVAEFLECIRLLRCLSGGVSEVFRSFQSIKESLGVFRMTGSANEKVHDY